MAFHSDARPKHQILGIELISKMLMRTGVSHLMWWLAVSLALSVLPMTGAGQTIPQYDGHWWLAAPPSEQYGFLSGHGDCYIYEYNGPDNYSESTASAWQNDITHFYQADPAKRETVVPDVVHQFRGSARARPPAVRQKAKPPHGYYDGLYWVQEWGIGGVKEQQGFIEGYLWCHANLVKNKDGTFSKTPAKYVALISQWYQVDPKTGDRNAEREPEAIANVLHRFRDGAPAEQK